MCLCVQVVKILEKHESARGAGSALSFLSAAASSVAARPLPIPPDEASAVQNYVEHMLFLLMEEEAGLGEDTQTHTASAECPWLATG